MKKHLRFLRLSIALLAMCCSFAVQATVFPYVTKLQNFGGISASTSTFTPIPGDYTLEVQGTIGTAITVAGGVYIYTPTTSGTVRFVQKSGVVYVYEGNRYMTSVTPSYSSIFPTIADANVRTDANNLLQNASFETLGTLVTGTAGTSTAKYTFASPWTTNVTIDATTNSIRVGWATGLTDGTALCIWRGTANTNYFAQPITATMKSNTFYKVVVRQSAGSNSAALFNIGLGSTVAGMEYGSKKMLLGNGMNGQYTVVLGTPASVTGTTYFTFKNTAINTATAGNQTDALTQIDYMELIEGAFGTPGITGVSSATFLDGTAYSPDVTVNYSGGDSYDMTPFIANQGFDNFKGEWVESPAANLGGYSNSEVEYYNKTFGLSQALTGLPAGIYRLKAQGFERAKGNDAAVAYLAGTEVILSKLYATSSVNTYTRNFNSLYLNAYQAGWGGTQSSNYLNDMLSAKNAFTAGYYDMQLEDIVVADGTLTVGASKATNVTNSWTIMDNFRLYYLGSVTEPRLSLPQTSAILTTVANTAIINLTGSNLTADITITVPSTHITLSGDNVTGTSPNYTIAVANANVTNNITVTWDKAANVSGNISCVSGAATKLVSVTTDDITSVAISGITLSAGGLNTAFAVGTTSYTVKVPADVNSVTITGTTTPTCATVTNNNSVISSSVPSVILTGNSYDGNAHTSAYSVTWGGNFAFIDWAANGSTDAYLSVPSIYGWSANPALTWVNANSTAAGTVRYMDMVNGANVGIVGITYTYNSVNFNGRIMFVRWDGGADARVYSYPVYLETGKVYNFNSKVAWNSVATAGTLTFNINSAKDNTGTSGGSGTAITGAAGTMVDGVISTISVPTTGVYYLNVTSSTASLCSLADLSISLGSVTGLDKVNSSLKAYTVDKKLTVTGVDNYVVYNVQGMKVADVKSNMANTTVTLTSGVYFVKSADAVQKILVK